MPMKEDEYRIAVRNAIAAEEEGQDLVQGVWILGRHFVEAHVQLQQAQGDQAVAGMRHLHLHQPCRGRVIPVDAF